MTLFLNVMPTNLANLKAALDIMGAFAVGFHLTDINLALLRVMRDADFTDAERLVLNNICTVVTEE